LAKGGSGDVLLGMITFSQLRILLRKIFNFWSLASRLCSRFCSKEKYSKEAMQPTDVIESLSEVLKFII
jgi:NAD(P)H-hydrate repair Nnr-like enzyme with NAD(P)H-hydrate dehydratase domain